MGIINEMNVLKGIYQEDMVIVVPHTSRTMGQFKVTLYSQPNNVILSKKVILYVKYTLEYPLEGPICRVDNDEDALGINHSQLQEIQNTIKTVIIKNLELQKECVYEILTSVENLLQQFDVSQTTVLQEMLQAKKSN